MREAAARTIAQRHFDVQLVGGWAMLNGMLAEMETGEGKTITATLAAAAAALAGRAVHVVTVNDYLAVRDADWMRPVYEALGLTVGVRQARHGRRRAARRLSPATSPTAATRRWRSTTCATAWCSAAGRGRSAPESRRSAGNDRMQRLLLRGLQFAIVDEADSVLVDEARTPLILSAQARRAQEEALHREALALAAQLSDGDFRIGAHGVEIRIAGWTSSRP